MSILNEKSKKVLVEAMRSCVCSILNESATLTAKQANDRSKFISESATYEQLLNITMNPDRDSNYLPSRVLEGAVAVLHSACMTGRYKIGINAITEGAIKLHKETGAVITESMLDAALASVERGSGLKVVGRIIQESAYDLLNFSDVVKNALNNAALDGGAALRANSAELQSNLLAHAQKIGLKNPDVAAQAWTRDILTSGGDVKKLSSIKRNIFNASKDYIRKNAQRTLNNTPTASLSANQLAQLKRHANKLGSRVGDRIPSGIDPRILQAAQNAQAKSGGSWQKALLYGGAGAAAALGGAYLWNRRNQNLANQQYDAQR